MFLKESDIRIGLKRKIFYKCVLLVTAYGKETSTLTKKSATKLRVTQRRMERSMLSVTLRDKIRNQQLRIRTGVAYVITRIGKMKWSWTGHIIRLNGGLERISEVEANQQRAGRAI